MWLSWPSVNTNKLFGVLKQLYWGRVKNISWHTSTPSMDWSSLCENKGISVSHLYSLWFGVVFFLFFEWCFSEAFLFYILFLSAVVKGIQVQTAATDLPHVSSLCEERTCGCTGRGVAWCVNESWKAKSWAYAKTSHCGRKLSLPVIQWKQMVFH